MVKVTNEISFVNSLIEKIVDNSSGTVGIVHLCEVIQNSDNQIQAKCNFINDYIIKRIKC